MGRASTLLPALREKALAMEKRRQPLAQNVNAMKSAGLINAAQPECYGGLGSDFGVVFNIAAELGRGCGSTAWYYSIWASHNRLMSLFPEEAQEECQADSPDTLSSTSFNPTPGSGSRSRRELSTFRPMGLFQRLR